MDASDVFGWYGHARCEGDDWRCSYTGCKPRVWLFCKPITAINVWRIFAETRCSWCAGRIHGVPTNRLFDTTIIFPMPIDPTVTQPCEDQVNVSLDDFLERYGYHLSDYFDGSFPMPGDGRNELAIPIGDRCLWGPGE